MIRSDGHQHTEVDARLIDTQAAGNVNEDIRVANVNAYPFIQHGDEQRDAVSVNAGCCVARVTIVRRHDECLDFHQQWTGAFHAGDDNRTRYLLLPIAEKELGRIQHVHKAFALHFKDADFVR